jgi:hypothetical protein
MERLLTYDLIDCSWTRKLDRIRSKNEKLNNIDHSPSRVTIKCRMMRTDREHRTKMTDNGSANMG